MSRDKKSKKPKETASDKVVPLNPPGSSQAGGASTAPSPDGPPSRPQTIEEAGLTLAQEVIANALEGAKDEEVIAKLLTTSIERHCISQSLMQHILMELGANTVHAQRTEGMVSYMMRRHGEPVQLPPKEGEKQGSVVFKTWYEEWRQAWERWEKRQIEAAGGAGNNGKTNGEEPGAPGKDEPGA